MKKLLFILFIIPVVSFSQISIGALPTSTSTATSDYLIKYKNRAEKISVADFITTYSLSGGGSASTQTLSIGSYSLSISNGNSVNLPLPYLTAIGSATLTGVPGGYTLTVSGGTSSATTQTITIFGVGSVTVTSNLGTNQGTTFTISVNSTTTYVRNGGNSFGGAMLIGTSDNFALSFKANNSTRMSINTNSIVSITGSLQITNSVTATNLSGTNTGDQTLSPTTNTITLSGGGGYFAIQGAGTTTVTTSGNNIVITTSAGGATYSAGSGLSLNPDNTFSISPTYAGQVSIVTTGTVTSGGWAGGVTPPVATSSTTASAMTLEGRNSALASYIITGATTAITFSYSNIPDGATVSIDYFKTTATNSVLTFPAGTVVSQSCNAIVSGLTATLVSTASGEFEITVIRHGSAYKVYIAQDVN